MATLVKIKYARKADHHPSVMRSVLTYCLNPEKTKHEQAWMVCGVNCAPETAYREFMANKTVWGKTDGLCFRHYVQSFHPNDAVTPEEMMEIGLEFACRAWPGYSVVIASHLDRDHKHNHFIIDTVHPENGRKLHEDRGNIARLRNLNDEICKAHGLLVLSPFAHSNTQSIGTREYRSGEKSESWKFRLRAAIKYAMLRSGNRTEFVATMRKLGYGVRWEDTRKHITYTCFREPKYKNGTYRRCRDIRLAHEKYTKENMEHEFEIRQEILAGRDDRTAQLAAYRHHTDGEDQRERMGSADTVANGNANIHPNDDADTTNATKRKRVGEADDAANLDHTVECHGNTDEGREEDAANRDRSTGWEAEREAYFSSHTMGEPPAVSVVGATHTHGASLGTRVVLDGLDALASFLSTDDAKTSEEAEEEERARTASENFGIVVGLIAAGLKLAFDHANSSTDENPTEEESPWEDYDEEDPMQML